MIVGVMELKRIPDYFLNVEFERCTPSCQKASMSESFLKKLNSARHIAGIPFILNSAYRTPQWDRSHGRSGEGYHTIGHAVDVRCMNGTDRYKIVDGAIRCGLSCGIYRTFIHLDDRPESVIFYGDAD